MVFEITNLRNIFYIKTEIIVSLSVKT